MKSNVLLRNSVKEHTDKVIIDFIVTVNSSVIFVSKDNTHILEQCAYLMKWSLHDEEYRQLIRVFGGIHSLAKLIEVSKHVEVKKAL